MNNYLLHQILPLFLISLPTVLTFNVNFTSRPWLRICAGTERYVLTGQECAGGFMFPVPFEIKEPLCICGNGIWILKSGYCDAPGTTFVLFAHENTCFQIKEKIRWIRYVGHPERAKLDAHYLVSSDWDYIEELHKNVASSLVASPNVWTMAVGDDVENIYLPEEKTCFRSDWRPLAGNAASGGVTGRPFVRMGKTVDPPANTLRESFQAQIISYCPYFAKEEQTVWMYAGGMLSTSRTGGTKYFPEPNYKVHANCSQKCTNAPPWKDVDITTVKPEVDVKMNEKYGMPDYPWSGEYSLGKNMTDFEKLTGNGTLAEFKCVVNEEASREMDKQTVRMIRAQAGFSLKQITSPKVIIKEYEYLQRSREILITKCPEISGQLVRSFLRMFRFALNETMDTHPYRAVGEEESHLRILIALASCTNESLGGHNKSMIAVFNETDCPRKFQFMKYQINESAAALVDRNCSSRIPKFLKFDNCKHDLVMEVAWKTILLTHYTCSRYFMNYSTDISEYYTVMERLFNPDLLMRFYNPGNSYKGMKFIFGMYDLQKFMYDLDHCLGCARDVSQYRAWLKRPKELRMCPMNGVENPPDAYNFNIMGYVGMPRNPMYIPYKAVNGLDYQCYSSWYDGLYTRPRQDVKPTCGLGMTIVGQTATFS